MEIDTVVELDAAGTWQEREPVRPQRQLIADAALLLVTLIWGSTFVMVKDAVSIYPVFSFLCLRFTLAALFLLPVAWWGSRNAPPPARRVREGGGKRAFPLSLAPQLVGLALFAGFAFQTFGLRLTTPAKAGFITGLSVVIVPLFAAVALRQSPGRGAWLGIGLATAGLAFLSWQPGQGIGPGDLLVSGCAVSYAAQILLTGRFAGRVDSLWLTVGQLLTVAALSGIAALIFETRPPLAGSVIFAAAFTGLLCSSLAFGVQSLAQRFTTAAHTALIFSAEPVFAALASFVLIGEALGPRQLAGCALILGGMLSAELIRSRR